MRSIIHIFHQTTLGLGGDQLKEETDGVYVLTSAGTFAYSGLNVLYGHADWIIAYVLDRARVGTSQTDLQLQITNQIE